MHPQQQTKPRWPLAEANAIAKQLIERLAPYTERIIIAGSIRREKPTAGDIEILYISKTEDRQLDMFATAPVNIADEAIADMLRDGTLSKRPSKNGTTAWGDKNKLAIHTPSGIPVDLFRTDEKSWHNYLVCRTGPAESNTRIAIAAQRIGYRWNPYGEGYTHNTTGKITCMESEEAVFRFVNLPYTEPKKRI